MTLLLQTCRWTAGAMAPLMMALAFWSCAQIRRPNVIVIVIDTARADHFSPYGYSRDTTPRFAAFSREAVHFRHAFATSSWTVPSHASLFTGLFPVTHQATQETQFLDNRFQTLAELLEAEGYETASFSNNPWVSQRTNLVQGFRHVQDMWRGRRGGGMPHATNRAVMDWLGTLDRQQPFFLFVNYIEPHWPYRAPPHFQDLFVGADVSPARREESNFKSIRWYMERPAIADSLLPIRTALYDAELAYVDDALGQLLHQLREEELYDSSLIVVTSDHGENLGDHGHQAHAFALYDSTIRIPLAIRPPGGRQAGTVRDDPVQLTDVFVALAAATGLKLQNDKIIGQNPLAGTLPEQRPLLSEYYYPAQFLEYFPKNPQADALLAPFKRRIRALQVGRHKLIWGSDGNSELYDTAQDPGEEHDLFQQEGERAAALEEKLQEMTTALQGDAVTPPTLPEMDEETRKRLRSLGYIR